MDQINGFMSAINELEKEDIKELAVASRISQADHKNFKKFIEG